MISIILGVILSFAVGLLIIIGILRLFGVVKYAVSLPVGHVIFIAIFSCAYFSGQHDAMANIVWVAPLLFDLPISLLLILFRTGSEYELAFMLAVLGTMQYWLIGCWVDRKRGR